MQDHLGKNNKFIKGYKTYLLAGVSLLSVSLGLSTSAAADELPNSNATEKVTTNNNLKISESNSESADLEIVSATSSASSTSAVSAVSQTDNSGSDVASSSVPTSSSASVQPSESLSSTVSSGNIDTATSSSVMTSASMNVQETELGDATTAQVDEAKASAAATFEKTGQAQVITRSSAAAANIKVDNGWAKDAKTNTSYFYRDGKKANGYLNDGSHWYLFKDGLKQSDVQKWAGTYYYFDHKTYLRVDNNYVKSNWGDYYLFGNDGRIRTDVQKWAGTYYYFNHSTFLRTDNAYVRSNWGDWYMFGNSGRIVTGLTQWYGSFYYFNNSTYLKAVNTSVNIGGTRYNFNGSGKLVSGTVTDNGIKYYISSNGSINNRTQIMAQIVATVKAQLGKPYIYGASGPSAFDCSGLVQYAFKQVGINLPRTTTQQEHVGTAVSLSNVQVGDLLFWGNHGSSYHVAVYVGNGLVIMAPKSNTVVRAEAMTDWMPSFARRVL